MLSVLEQRRKCGVRLGTDFTWKSPAKSCINAEIFAEYIRTVFLPNFNELQTRGEFTDELQCFEWTILRTMLWKRFSLFFEMDECV
jgi:hypothetical protein